MDTPNERLRKIRISQGLNPKEAARILGITTQYLSRIENGHQRPSRNRLEIMVQKYSLPLEDAELLKSMYGYGTSGASSTPTARVTSDNSAAVLPKIELDSVSVPILYTDMLAINSDEFGMVINIGQKDSITNKVQIVSRVALSIQHAERFYEALGQNIRMLKDSIQSGKNTP